MKKFKFASLGIIALLGLAILSGCTNEEQSSSSSSVQSSSIVESSQPSQSSSKVFPDITSDTLYAKKIDIPEDFIMGMDASCVPSLEASGVKFYDFDGKEKDVYEVLANNGINYIRVRVWNDPFDANGNGYGGGNCDINNCIEIGKRATKYGMKLLVDFHYSDFWADPAKQMVPKAWASMKPAAKAEALGAYTKACLEQLKAAKVDVGMVSLGNEFNGKLAGETTWYNVAYHLLNAGTKAVREVLPEALIALHFANPEKVSNYRDYAEKLAYYEIDYDVFASSYYPYWHGTLANLESLLNEISTTYNKKVMVAETSYAYTGEDTDFFANTISDGGTIVKDYPFTVQGQANCMSDVIETVATKMPNGIGVFYWEGTWISVGTTSFEENSPKWEKYGSGWAASYSAGYDAKDAGQYYGGSACDNQALFDSTGHPLESLKIFSLVRKGNTVAAEADAIQDTTLIIDLNGEIKLPETVNAVMKDNSKKVLPVVWDNPDYDAMKNGGVAKYEITGKAGGMTAKCFISMVEYNFLENYSFEEGDTGWTPIVVGKMDEFHYEDKASDSLTGTGHYHFWSAASNSVEFYLEQEVNDLPAGKYKFSISIMGGDCGDSTIYAYVKVNGTIVDSKNAPLTINGYGEWDTAVVEDIDHNGTDKITVGIYVKCAGSGNGAWGKIDDGLLNSVK